MEKAAQQAIRSLMGKFPKVRKRRILKSLRDALAVALHPGEMEIQK